MNDFLSFGVDVNLWLQQFSPAMDIPFKAITFCGEELFFLIFLPLIYWSINRFAGARLLVIFLISAWTNSLIKVLADDPRPFQYDSRVKGMQHMTDGGFPSGHTQGSVVVWGYLAAMFKKRWLWILAAAMITLIPLSRLYLGVHDIPDLIGGYVIGFIILILFIWLEPHVVRMLRERNMAVQLAVSIIIPAAMAFISLRFNEESIASAATLMGMSAGFVLERRFIGFSSDGSISNRILRYILGLAVIIGLWIGLKIVFKGLEPVWVFRFLRYLLIGLWGAFAAPWVFVKLKLADLERN